MFGVQKVDATRTPVSPTHTRTQAGQQPTHTHTHTRLDNQYIRCTFPFVRHGPSGHNDNNNCTTTTLLQAQKRCVYVLGVCPASLSGCLAGWLPVWRVSMSMSYPFAVLYELTVHSQQQQQPQAQLACRTPSRFMLHVTGCVSQRANMATTTQHSNNSNGSNINSNSNSSSDISNTFVLSSATTRFISRIRHVGHRN